MRKLYKIIRKIYYQTKFMDIDSLDNLKNRGLVVGKNFKKQPGVAIDSSHCWLIVIGDDVTLAPNVHILAHDASTK